MPAHKKGGKRKAGKPPKNGVKKKARRGRGAASEGAGAAKEPKIVRPRPPAPEFDGKRLGDMTKEQLNVRNARQMRKYRALEALKRVGKRFSTEFGGSALQIVDTGGGSFRRGRHYLYGSGRYGGEFPNTNIRGIIEMGDLTWKEAAQMPVHEFITAMSEGAAQYDTGATEIAHEAREKRKRESKDAKKKRGVVAPPPAAAPPASGDSDASVATDGEEPPRETSSDE